MLTRSYPLQYNASYLSPSPPDLHSDPLIYPIPVHGHQTCGRRFQKVMSPDRPHDHQGEDTGTVRNKDEGESSGFSESNLLCRRLDGTYQVVGRNMASRQHGRITDMYRQEGTWSMDIETLHTRVSLTSTQQHVQPLQDLVVHPTARACPCVMQKRCIGA